MPFFEQAVRRLKTGGQLGWSISNTFLRSKFGRPLREFLGGTCSIQELVEFENPKVYADAVTQIVLVQLTKAIKDEPCRHVWVCGNPDLRDALEAVQGQGASVDVNLEVHQLSKNSLCGSDWRLSTETSKLDSHVGKSRTLKELGVQITQGIVLGPIPCTWSAPFTILGMDSRGSRTATGNSTSSSR